MTCPVVHYVGFRDDRYSNARRIFGGPAFIHFRWDQRAQREIAPGDVIVFAEGDWRDQKIGRFNGPDIIEKEPDYDGCD